MRVHVRRRLIYISKFILFKDTKIYACRIQSVRVSLVLSLSLSLALMSVVRFTKGFHYRFRTREKGRPTTLTTWFYFLSTLYYVNNASATQNFTVYCFHSLCRFVSIYLPLSLHFFFASNKLIELGSTVILVCMPGLLVCKMHTILLYLYVCNYFRFSWNVFVAIFVFQSQYKICNSMYTHT